MRCTSGSHSFVKRGNSYDRRITADKLSEGLVSVIYRGGRTKHVRGIERNTRSNHHQASTVIHGFIGRTGRPDHLGAIAWPRDARHDPIPLYVSSGPPVRWLEAGAPMVSVALPYPYPQQEGAHVRCAQPPLCHGVPRVQKSRNPICSSLPLRVVQFEPARLPRPGYCVRVTACVWRCSTPPNTQKRTSSVGPTDATRPDGEACQTTTTTLELREATGMFGLWLNVSYFV